LIHQGCLRSLLKYCACNHKQAILKKYRSLTFSSFERIHLILARSMFTSRQSTHKWGRTWNHALITHDTLRPAVQPPLDLNLSFWKTNWTMAKVFVGNTSQIELMTLSFRLTNIWILYFLHLTPRFNKITYVQIVPDEFYINWPSLILFKILFKMVLKKI
jgi:hypothetical protein